MLDGCLLTDEEMIRGPDSWLALEDPFPPTPEDEDEEEGDDRGEVSEMDGVTLLS